MTDLQDQAPQDDTADATNPDAPTEDAPVEASQDAPAAPPEGADHPDPYAHLGSDAPTGEE